jgi:hypothetical protein
MMAFATPAFADTMPTAFMDVRHPRDRRVVAHPGVQPWVPDAPVAGTPPTIQPSRSGSDWRRRADDDQ